MSDQRELTVTIFCTEIIILSDISFFKEVSLFCRISAVMYDTLGVTTALFEAGTALKRRVKIDVPIDCEVEVDISSKKLALKTGLPQSVSTCKAVVAF